MSIVLAPGAGIRRPGGQPGTFGCVVRRTDSSAADAADLYLLTAGHVLLAQGAHEADSVLSVDPDSGDAPVATISDFIDCSGGESQADAAIAKLSPGIRVLPGVAGLGVPAGATPLLDVGDPVQIFGFASGLSQGWIVATEHSEDLELDLPTGRRTVHFNRLVLCTRFTRPGDSGAAVVDARRQVLGIHLGSTRTTSFFCRINPIIAALHVEVVTGMTPAS